MQQCHVITPHPSFSLCHRNERKARQQAQEKAAQQRQARAAAEQRLESSKPPRAAPSLPQVKKHAQAVDYQSIPSQPLFVRPALQVLF